MEKPWEHDSPVDDSPLENHGKSWNISWNISWKIMENMIDQIRIQSSQISSHKARQGSALGSAHRAPSFVPVACSKVKTHWLR